MGRRRHIFAPRESLIQAAVVDHWTLLGLPDTLVAAIPNANAHGQPGLTPGLPDLLVLGPGLPHGVGFIELKRTARSLVSDDQLRISDLCRALDIPYELTVGRDEPILVLERWGVVSPQARAA
jgi:hypothetical protein